MRSHEEKGKGREGKGREGKGKARMSARFVRLFCRCIIMGSFGEPLKGTSTPTTE